MLISHKRKTVFLSLFFLSINLEEKKWNYSPPWNEWWLIIEVIIDHHCLNWKVYAYRPPSIKHSCCHHIFSRWVINGDEVLEKEKSLRLIWGHEGFLLSMLRKREYSSSPPCLDKINATSIPSSLLSLSLSLLNL